MPRPLAAIEIAIASLRQSNPSGAAAGVASAHAVAYPCPAFRHGDPVHATHLKKEYALKFARLLFVPSAIAIAFALSSFSTVSVLAHAPDAATLDRLAKATVPFVPNAGQWDERAAFAAQTLAGTVFVTKKGELIYSLPGKPVASALSPDATSPLDKLTRKNGAPAERTAGWVISESFVDRNNTVMQASAHGYRPQTAQVSYFIGPDETKHQRGLNTYERVNLGNVYPGINVQLRATGNNIEKIFYRCTQP